MLVRGSLPKRSPRSTTGLRPVRTRFAARVAGHATEVENRLSASAHGIGQKLNEQVTESETRLMQRANVIADTFAAVGQHISQRTNEAAKSIGENTRELNAMLASRSAEFRKSSTKRPSHWWIVSRKAGASPEKPRRRDAARNGTPARGKCRAGQRAGQPHRRNAHCRRGRKIEPDGRCQRSDRPPVGFQHEAERTDRENVGEPQRRRRAARFHDTELRRDDGKGCSNLRQLGSSDRRQCWPADRPVVLHLEGYRCHRQPLRRPQQAFVQRVRPARFCSDKPCVEHSDEREGALEELAVGLVKSPRTSSA